LAEVAVAVTERGAGTTTLRALTTAALALPGLSGTVQGAAPAERNWEAGYFYYDEAGGRMSVEAAQQLLTVPVGDQADFTLNAVWDAISGASPIYNIPEIHCADGSVTVPPVDSVSGASGDGGGPGGTMMQAPSLEGSGCSLRSGRQVLLQDTFSDIRKAADVRLNFYPTDTLTLGLGAGLSREKDYDSDFFSLDLRRELNEKHTTLAAGYSFAADTFSPLNQPDFRGDKDTHQWLLGFTQVLSRTALLQVNLTHGYNQGYLSDPYKSVYVFQTNEAVPEVRPGSRRQWGLLTRYVRYLPDFGAALHLDYRYSTDDWGLRAHTLEVAWIQELAPDWELVPRLRYYTQGEADFYYNYLTAMPDGGHYSSDYRLAGFGAVSAGLKLSREWRDGLRIDLGAEFYDRKSAYGLIDHTPNRFSDYSAALYSLSLNFRF
jgi:hypothetical protein